MSRSDQQACLVGNLAHTQALKYTAALQDIARLVQYCKAVATLSWQPCPSPCCVSLPLNWCRPEQTDTPAKRGIPEEPMAVPLPVLGQESSVRDTLVLLMSKLLHRSSSNHQQERNCYWSAER